MTSSNSTDKPPRPYSEGFKPIRFPIKRRPSSPTYNHRVPVGIWECPCGKRLQETLWLQEGSKLIQCQKCHYLEDVLITGKIPRESYIEQHDDGIYAIYRHFNLGRVAIRPATNANRYFHYFNQWHRWLEIDRDSYTLLQLNEVETPPLYLARFQDNAFETIAGSIVVSDPLLQSLTVWPDGLGWVRLIFTDDEHLGDKARPVYRTTMTGDWKQRVRDYVNDHACELKWNIY